MARGTKSRDKIAFNFWRIAYDYGFPAQPNNEIIKFSSASEGPHVQVDKLVENNENQIPPPNPGTAELQVNDDDKNIGVWVGFRPPYAEQYQDIGANKGTAIDDPAKFELLPTDPKALRVIAKIGDIQVNYFALYSLDPTSGLCKAAGISQRDVFFFKRFRDDKASSASLRISTFRQKVADITKNKNQKALQLDRTHDKQKSDIDPKCAYERTSNEENLQNALEHLDEAEGSQSLQQYKALYKLVRGDKVLNLEDCKVAMKEFVILYPDIPKLCPHWDKVIPKDILQLSREIHDDEICVPYHLLRPLISGYMVQRASCRGQETLEEFDGTHQACRDLEDLERRIGKIDSTVDTESSPSSDSVGKMTQGLPEDAKAVKDFAKKWTQELQNSQGTLAIPDPLLEVLEKKKDAPDLDFLKLYGTTVHRHTVDYLLTGVINKVVSQLDELVSSCEHVARSVSPNRSAEEMEVGDAGEEESEDQPMIDDSGTAAESNTFGDEGEAGKDVKVEDEDMLDGGDNTFYSARIMTFPSGSGI
ncbi:MAG: hypothetical protein M1820_006443 [Bogoriella megaspora]|nr:MAG: hypothetical protein M1820_006443 [Bogoriella megaspora]